MYLGGGGGVPTDVLSEHSTLYYFLIFVDDTLPGPPPFSLVMCVQGRVERGFANLM